MTNPPRAYINAGGTHPRMSRFEIWISRRGSAHSGARYGTRKRPCTIVTPHNPHLPHFCAIPTTIPAISLHRDQCDARRATRLKIEILFSAFFTRRGFLVSSRVFLVKSGKVIRSTMTVAS